MNYETKAFKEQSIFARNTESSWWAANRRGNLWEKDKCAKVIIGEYFKFDKSWKEDRMKRTRLLCKTQNSSGQWWLSKLVKNHLKSLGRPFRKYMTPMQMEARLCENL